MNKTLVLAEKPSVARDYARVLRCNKKGNGFLEGDRYIITWALGHLITLADPEKYDSKYATWRIEDLPMLPSDLKLEVIKQTSKHFHAVKSQLLRKDVSSIVIATDAGREGELIARWILEKANVKKPLKRLWISSVTDKAILEGFNQLQPGSKYENLYASAVARSAADWYVGLNATRALTCKYNAQLSCGRVQTPTLAIIAQREKEIKEFQPKDYYGIQAQLKGLTLTWQNSKSNQTRIIELEKCKEIMNRLDRSKCEIVDVEKANKKSFSPQLYDLTELQRDANRLFNFSAKETLSIMQTLYERHKLLTYPRTDSRYLSEDIVPTLKDRVKACGVGYYSKLGKTILALPIKGNKSFVDNTKVSDHHAIIPTEEPLYITQLSDNERKVYDLVVKRFFAVLYPPFEYTQTTIKAHIGSELFTAKGQIIIKEGWKEVYKEDASPSPDEQRLPNVHKGDSLEVISIIMTQGKTSPPAPFTEGTLLSAMENPTKYMNVHNKNFIETLQETGGLGTVATRADIIEKLFNSFLIEKRNQSIHITSKGLQLLDLVPEDIKSPVLTAKWEQELEQIAKGNLKSTVFINNIKGYTKNIVNEIKNNEAKFKHTNVTGDRCPDCGKFMLEVKGKKGKLLVCQDRECGHRKNLAKVTNARCPECHKKLELVGEGEGQRFICKCGYREKLSVFNERKKESGKGVTKKDVSKYLKNQQKDEPVLNSAFADMLKKLK